MVVREMIKDDIPQLAQLYKQFWNDESCIDAMYIKFDKFHKNGSHRRILIVKLCSLHK